MANAHKIISISTVNTQTAKSSKKSTSYTKIYVKPSIFEPALSTSSTTLLASIPSKQGRKQKSRVSKLNKNKNLLSNSNLNLSLDDTDMSIKTIGNQTRLVVDNNLKSETQNSLVKTLKHDKKPVVMAILKEVESQTSIKLLRGNIKNASMSFKLLAKPKKSIEPVKKNYYAKYLEGKSNLNLKSELAFVRKKQDASLQSFDSNDVYNQRMVTPTEKLNSGYMNFLSKTSNPVFKYLYTLIWKYYLNLTYHLKKIEDPTIKQQNLNCQT